MRALLLQRIMGLISTCYSFADVWGSLILKNVVLEGHGCFKMTYLARFIT